MNKSGERAVVLVDWHLGDLCSFSSSSTRRIHKLTMSEIFRCAARSSPRQTIKFQGRIPAFTRPGAGRAAK